MPRDHRSEPATLDRESYTVRRFVTDHCAALGDEYADTFRRDLLRMLDEVREAERERIVGIVEERAENGEPVAKLVRAIRRRGNDQTSGNAAEPSAVVTEQHAPARAPEEAGTISRTKVKHPWANVVATAVCVVDGSATQHDLVVAVRAMQDKAYGVPRSAEAQADDDFIWDACEVHGRFKLGPKMGGRFRAACPACEGPRSNEAKPAVAACSECGATSGSFCASLVDGKPLCFPECRPRSDKATPRPWNAMPHTHGMWTVEREIVPAENVAGRSYRADVICEVSPTEARYGESARSAEENARRIADALNDQYGWYGPNTEAALRRERDCPSPTERRAWGHADSDEAEMWTGAFATREEAIADGRQNYPGEAFWIVEGTYPDPAEFTPNADSIIDTMIENASAEVGDAVDNWEPSDGAEKALDELLEAWARRHMPTNFYIADGVKERIDPLPDRKRNPMASDSSSEGKRGGESR